MSYGIKMSSKHILEYVVPPSEGLWDGGDAGIGGPTNKAKLTWTALIRQPDFVTAEILDATRLALAKRKPSLDTTLARLETLTEGLCVQALHVGSYDDEPATIATMQSFAADQGYAPDWSDGRRHHEIYLSDPRKTPVDKLKTILRHPVKPAIP